MMLPRALVVVVATGCGTRMPSWVPDAGACEPYMSTADLTSPTTSFTTDVMPIFGSNCASASCHGIADSPQGGVFLGAELAHGSDAATVFAALVNMPSGELPTMQLVTPGDPTQSFLIHKLDGDQCLYESTCVGANCMQQMPFSTMALDAGTRDVVRRWIAQGASNN